jgi:hypothetical protein
MSFAPSSPPSISHLSGLNDLASGPQNASDRLIAITGIMITVPFAMAKLSTSFPSDVLTGVDNGSVSSSFAYIVDVRKGNSICNSQSRRLPYEKFP